jgi:uncharacterized protein YutE (UPF0331/DUF86 family)
VTVDREKIRQKLQYMREKLRKLKRFQGMNLNDFRDDVINEDAAIRMLQVIIEAMLDICAHVIAREGWGLTRTYVDTIEVATRHGLIPNEMCETYANMARFRNRVVHLYDEVDPNEILDIVNNRLDAFHPFIANIIQRYLTEDASQDSV